METQAGPRSNRLEYIVAIVVNVLVLVIANEILSWGILPFLTSDFRQVLPLFNISLGVTIAANIAFLFFDPDWFKAPLRAVLNAIGLAVVVRFLTVFPFDFSAYPGFNWLVLAKVFLILGIVGCAIGIIAEAVRFVVALVRLR